MEGSEKCDGDVPKKKDDTLGPVRSERNERRYVQCLTVKGVGIEVN